MSGCEVRGVECVSSIYDIVEKKVNALLTEKRRMMMMMLVDMKLVFCLAAFL